MTTSNGYYNNGGHDTPNPKQPWQPVIGKEFDEKPISSYFGELTFGLRQMRERLPRDAYQCLVNALENRKKIRKETADAIALAVKDWAVSKGVTYFCHWFQPLTGLTAEKHDAFITIQNSNHSELTVIEHFSGSQLIQGEPDASSFPNGGTRSTFEARGYTAWDPGSPIFIVEDAGVKTLCIPSAFCDYYGNALDQKTPLLRSIEVLSDKASEFLKLLGDVDVKSVVPTLGSEQEFFLVDREMANERPDLILTGRTVLGAGFSRGQKLEDHYFGSIPARAKAFFKDFGIELYRLGVPVKTRHNEVAPSQFEMAPIFEDMAISADHNTLAMEAMKRIALRHNLLCILHEKPFAEVNGSGKHCNWSLRNDKGQNLLEPGKTPHQNLRFLAVLSVVIQAVHQHSAILAASISSAGNELRLGGNEAPPSIISIFLGSMLEEILGSIEKGETAKGTKEAQLNLGVSQIPDIAKDTTDRNRTSPFAFTGNKFEFRAVGSSANVSVSMSVLNAAVADAFAKASARLTSLLSQEKTRDEAVVKLISATIKENKNVLFSGNNYSDDWRAEARKRGLPIIKNCDEAFDILNDGEETKFLSELGILNEGEIKSRYNIAVDRYITTLSIEYQVLQEMVFDYVIPALENQLLRSHGVGEGLEHSRLRKNYSSRVMELEEYLDQILDASERLRVTLEDIADSASHKNSLKLLREAAEPIACQLRSVCDQAELKVADEFWDLPKYRELLFSF